MGAEVGVANTNVEHERWPSMIADPGTRCESVRACSGELLPSAGGDREDAVMPEGTDPFARAQAQFSEIVSWLGERQTGGMEHGELEAELGQRGRELLRVCFQDHVDLRTIRETREDGVTGAEGVARTRVESGHHRELSSVFGKVTVSRLAYRAKGQQNLYVADGLLNLPEEHASHGVRRIAASEAAAGSFEHATGQVNERTGLGLGKHQVEQLAVRAAVDFERFYTERASGQRELPDGEQERRDVLVLSADGKGIVMRTEALREATRQAAARASPKLKTRLSKGEKAGRKRIAEVGAVYEIEPAPRTPAEVLAPTKDKTLPAPRATRKWLTASIVNDAASVIADIFDEAERRDRAHERTWVALVDGNNHQIDRIATEARKRKVKITIIVDFVHVLEYLWTAAWSFFKEGDPAAESWVHDKALAVLEGKAAITAAAIRRKATLLGLTDEQRSKADRTADYLLNKARHLDYPTALTNGWPIATGIIEGACRHLVKDRMDITGARWGLEGAEAILKLRALLSNGDLDEYWDFHLTHERHRNHDKRYANDLIPRPST